MRIPLAKPEVLEPDIAAVVSVLRSSQLSQGPVLRDFENSLAAYLNASHALAVNSGTSALQLALTVLGVQPGDEVILPSLGFMAVTNAVLAVGAIPVYIDITPGTLNLDPDRIEQVLSPQTRAIIAVHSFGYPAQMEKVIAVAHGHGLPVIEDACEAIGGEIKGQKVGTFGDVGIFAFYPNKQITTGEGGALVTNSAKIAEKARSLSNQGRASSHEWFQHTNAGYSYRLSDINCALGRQQLLRLESIIEKRAKLANLYTRCLEENREVQVYPANSDSRMSWFALPIRLPAAMSQLDRDDIWQALKELDIETARYFPPAHLQPVMTKFQFRCGDLSETISVSQRLLCLPFFNSLQEREIQFVCSMLDRIVHKRLHALHAYAAS